LAKADLPAQLLGGGRPLPTAFGPSQRGQQPAGIARGAQEVGGFHQTCEFGGGYQGDIPSAFPANDHYFLIVDDAVQDTRKVFA
jgi:hypothetical protein